MSFLGILVQYTYDISFAGTTPTARVAKAIMRVLPMTVGWPCWPHLGRSSTVVGCTSVMTLKSEKQKLEKS